MKMKTKILLAVAPLIFFAITGCKEDEHIFSNDFTLSSQEAAFDGNTLNFGPELQTIAINIDTETHAGKWNAICPIEDLWCSFSNRGNQLMVTVTLNNTGAVRSTWIEFSIGDNVQRINVNQDYLRLLSFSTDAITVAASRHDEYIPLLTNIAPEKLSASITNPVGCDWISGISVSSIGLSFTIQRNGSLTDMRSATITVTGDGETASLVITQNVISGYPYVIDISVADFSDCYIYEIWDDLHNIKIGDLCKEYLHKNNGTEIVRMQSVVAYPMANGEVDLSKGLVVENGYFIGWNLNVTAATAPSDILETYMEGESVSSTPTVIYLDEGASRMTTHDLEALPEDRVYATLKPYLLHDQRSGPANTVGDTQEDFTYKIVKVGAQYWMAENLRTSRYNDGENIPTNIANADWALIPGAPGCVISSETGTRYLDVNASGAAQTARMDVGVLYNFNAIVRQNSLANVAMSNLQDMISPSGWHVPTQAQLEILRKYASQSTVATNIIIPELHYAATGAFANATGFGMRGNGQRGASGGWNSDITLLGSITYTFYSGNADHLQHGYYSLRMVPSTGSFMVGGTGTSSQGSNFYVVIAGHHVRCLRE